MYLEMRKFGKLALLILCKVVFKHPNKDARKCDPSGSSLGFWTPFSLRPPAQVNKQPSRFTCVFLETPREDDRGSRQWGAGRGEYCVVGEMKS